MSISLSDLKTLQSSFFIIQPSTFIILHSSSTHPSSFVIRHSSFLHFATFKLFSLFLYRSFFCKINNTKTAKNCEIAWYFQSQLNKCLCQPILACTAFSQLEVLELKMKMVRPWDPIVSYEYDEGKVTIDMTVQPQTFWMIFSQFAPGRLQAPVTKV